MKQDLKMGTAVEVDGEVAHVLIDGVMGADDLEVVEALVRAANQLNCLHDKPLTVMNTADSFRAHLPAFNTSEYSYRGRYYQVFVYQVRCEECKAVFHRLYICDWHRDGFPAIRGYGNDAEYRDVVSEAIKVKYGVRLAEFGIVAEGVG